MKPPQLMPMGLIVAFLVGGHLITPTPQVNPLGEPQARSMPLSGFRSLLANYGWLRVHDAWMQQDWESLQSALDWVAAVDPRPLDFWLNGARMLGYDGSQWLARDGMPNPTARHRAKTAALRHLERAREFHPQSYELELEAALLHLRLGGDLAAVVSALERASACPRVPYFVGRLRAEFLIRDQREDEALAWLQTYRRMLPAEDPEAMVELIDARIADLVMQLRTQNPPSTPP